MQNVSQAWEQTNRDNFTRPAGMILSFTFADDTTATVSDSRIITFNYSKSGDILSGVLTQDTIKFEFDNFDGQFTYNPENDKYTGATVAVTCTFTAADYESSDPISGGLYYITDVNSENKKTTFTAKSILAFMKSTVDDISGTCRQVVQSIITDANNDPAVPADNITYSLDSSLNSVTVSVYKTDNLSQAEVLQLIANACGCILYSDRTGRIHIEKLGTIAETYVLSGKISYEFPKAKVLEKVGRVMISYDHGAGSGGTSGGGQQIGATQTMTNPIINDDFDAQAAMRNAYDIQQVARRRISGNFRADPRLDLFDIVSVPYQDMLSVCTLTKLNFTFNGGWRGTYEAIEISGSDVDMRICDIEMITAGQLESLRIEQLHPNTISDSDGNYMAASGGRLAFWEEDDEDNGEL